jgi:hypothetical protein
MVGRIEIAEKKTMRLILNIVNPKHAENTASHVAFVRHQEIDKGWGLWGSYNVVLIALCIFWVVHLHQSWMYSKGLIVNDNAFRASYRSDSITFFGLLTLYNENCPSCVSELTALNKIYGVHKLATYEAVIDAIQEFAYKSTVIYKISFWFPLLLILVWWLSKCQCSLDKPNETASTFTMCMWMVRKLCQWNREKNNGYTAADKFHLSLHSLIFTVPIFSISLYYMNMVLDLQDVLKQAYPNVNLVIPLDMHCFVYGSLFASALCCICVSQLPGNPKPMILPEFEMTGAFETVDEQITEKKDENLVCDNEEEDYADEESDDDHVDNACCDKSEGINDDSNDENKDDDDDQHANVKHSAMVFAKGNPCVTCYRRHVPESYPYDLIIDPDPNVAYLNHFLSMNPLNKHYVSSNQKNLFVAKKE